MSIEQGAVIPGGAGAGSGVFFGSGSVPFGVTGPVPGVLPGPGVGVCGAPFGTVCGPCVPGVGPCAMPCGGCVPGVVPAESGLKRVKRLIFGSAGAPRPVYCNAMCM